MSPGTLEAKSLFKIGWGKLLAYIAIDRIEWQSKATFKSRMTRPPELCEVKGIKDGGQALDIKLFKLGPEQNAEFGMHKTILAHFTYEE
jgi:hypothetical protein